MKVIIEVSDNYEKAQLKTLLAKLKVKAVETMRSNEKKIYELLFELGIDKNKKGFKYLLIGINYCMHDSRYINSLSKALYPRIAKTVGTGESSAARLINEALKTADRGKNKELWEKVTGSAERKFTVAEFLTAVCNYIEHGETGEV